MKYFLSSAERSGIFIFPLCFVILAPNGVRPAPCALHGVPAGGRDETTPLCRNQPQATQTAQKRADSHQSGARCVSPFHYLEILMGIEQPDLAEFHHQ